MTEQDEMVDRVAEALWGNPSNKRVKDLKWETFDEAAKDEWRKDARRAIEAMREPTKAMYDAHSTYCKRRYDVGNAPTKEGSWHAMIDAALAHKRGANNRERDSREV